MINASFFRSLVFVGTVSVTGCTGAELQTLPSTEGSNLAQLESNLTPKEVMMAVRARSRVARANGVRERGTKREYDRDGTLRAEFRKVSNRWVPVSSTLPAPLTERPLDSFLAGNRGAAPSLGSNVTIKTLYMNASGHTSYDTVATDIGAAASLHTSETGQSYGYRMVDLGYNSSANAEKIEHMSWMESYNWRQDWEGSWYLEEVTLTSEEIAAGIADFHADTVGLVSGGSLRTFSAGNALLVAPEVPVLPGDCVDDLLHEQSLSPPRPPDAQHANCTQAYIAFKRAQRRSNVMGVGAVLIGAFFPPAAGPAVSVYVLTKADYVVAGMELNDCYRMYGY